MEIKPGTIPQVLLDLVPRPAQEGPIRPGQTLLAMVSEMAPPRPPEAPIRPGQTLLAMVTETLPRGRAILDIGGHPVEIRSSLPLVVGQQLRVMVELSDDRLLLRLLDKPVNHGQSRELLASALRAALPKQAELVPLLRSLMEAVQPPPAPRLGAPAAPAEVQWPKPFMQFARQMIAALPNREQVVTPEGLRAAIARSGLFLEARLAQGQTPQPGGDLKADLVRLAAWVNTIAENPVLPVNPAVAAALAMRVHTAPPPRDSGAAVRLAEAAVGILRQTEGALERTRVSQLQTLDRSTREDPDWVLELPVRSGEKELERLRLRIRRQTGNGKQGHGKAGWSVTITHEDDSHGTLHMVVGLTSDRISATFWADREETAALFADKLEFLRQRLLEAGLNVEHLVSRQGTPPDDDENDSPAPTQGTLDVQA